MLRATIPKQWHERTELSNFKFHFGLWTGSWQGPFSSPEAALLLVSTKNYTSGRVQHQKSMIHWLPVTLCMLRVKSDWLRTKRILRAFSEIWTLPILGADQKKQGLWEWLSIIRKTERSNQGMQDRGACRCCFWCACFWWVAKTNQ